MHHPSAAQFTVLAAVLGLAALLALWRCLSGLRRDRIVGDTPLARIRSAAQGYVRLQGRAAAPPDGNDRSPLTGRPCVWWSYQISERQEDSRGRSHWHTVETAESVAPFTLSDTDGQCLVGPVGAEITPTTHDVWYGESARPFGPPPDQVSILISGPYRYSERLIAIGARLTVLGELRSRSAVTAPDDEVRALLDSWKKDQAALLSRFDRNRDGRIDAAEWEAARAAARAQVESGAVSAAIERTSVVGQTTHGEPFLVAPLDEAQLVRREKAHALIALAASLALLALSLWALQKARSQEALSNCCASVLPARAVIEEAPPMTVWVT